MSRGRPIHAVPILFIAAVVARIAWSGTPADALMMELPVVATAPVSAATFWLVVGFIGVPLTIVALLSAFLGWSLRPILAFHVLGACLLLVQLFLTPDLGLPLVGPESSARISMTVVATRLGALAEGDRLPQDPELLEQTLAGLPPHGETKRRWRIEKADCASVDDLPPALPTGLALYCISPGGSIAWLAWSGGEEGFAESGPSEGGAVERIGHQAASGALRWMLILPNRAGGRR